MFKSTGGNIQIGTFKIMDHDDFNHNLLYEAIQTWVFHHLTCMVATNVLGLK